MVVVLGLGAAAAVTHSSPPPKYLFDDEFTSLDLTKWQPNWLGSSAASITPPINGAEQSCYDPARVAVANGHLILTAVSQSCLGFQYASGLVESRPHFTFTYGKLEARVWTQGSAGKISNWPAVWSDGTGTWPVTGENDTMEGLSGRACWHFHSPAGGPGGCLSQPRPYGWHLYASEWRAGSVTYSYDGVQVGKIVTGVTNAPMYVILNLGVGGYGGPTQIPGRMGVDYIRVSAG